MKQEASDRKRKYNAAWRKSHLEYHASAQRKYYRENSEKHNASTLARRKARGQEWLKAASARWRKNVSQGTRTAYQAKRNAILLLACPEWADLDAIRKIYEQAKIDGLHVDHIIPLQGKTVCGLHVHTNLQLLSRSANCRKGNSFVDVAAL